MSSVLLCVWVYTIALLALLTHLFCRTTDSTITNWKKPQPRVAGVTFHFSHHKWGLTNKMKAFLHNASVETLMREEELVTLLVSWRCAACRLQLFIYHPFSCSIIPTDWIKLLSDLLQTDQQMQNMTAVCSVDTFLIDHSVEIVCMQWCQ